MPSVTITNIATNVHAALNEPLKFIREALIQITSSTTSPIPIAKATMTIISIVLGCRLEPPKMEVVSVFDCSTVRL